MIESQANGGWVRVLAFFVSKDHDLRIREILSRLKSPVVPLLTICSTTSAVLYFLSCWNNFTKDNWELQWLPQTSSSKIFLLTLFLFLILPFTTFNLRIHWYDCHQASNFSISLSTPARLSLSHSSHSISYSHLNFGLPHLHWRLSRDSGTMKKSTCRAKQYLKIFLHKSW